ncbi:hypothetical protein ACKKBF_B10760 [Auxenochlorella protothecoides x Auxenochlorella symbiontica]
MHSLAPQTRHGVAVRAHNAAPVHVGPLVAPPPMGAYAPHAMSPLDRRAALVGLMGVGYLPWIPVSPASAARSPPSQPVRAYLPPASTPGFVQYTPDEKKTPAIRAGVIKPDPSFYTFVLPENWSEGLILNILSGNFCMPRCDEPWYEALFQNQAEGKAQLIVAPLFRLISKAGAQLSDIGPPERAIEKVGNYVTGSSLEAEDDVISATSKTLSDGRTYYIYELNALQAKDGPHILASLTIKGDQAYLFVVSASEKQWARSQSKLQTIRDSFRA